MFSSAQILKRGLLVTVILAIFAALIYCFQNKFIFFPVPLHAPPELPEVPGRVFKHVSFPNADGITLHGVLLTHSSATDANVQRPFVVWSHGNGGNLAHRLPRLARLAELPADFLLYDYRGYGQCQGSPSVRGVRSDAHSALQFVQNDLGIPVERMVLYGVSLGVGVAAVMAEPYLDRIAALVLESGFRSLAFRASAKFPIIGSLVLQEDLPTTDILSRYHGRLLVIHSKADEVIPFTDSQAIFAAAPTDDKTFLELQDYSHGAPVWDAPAYLQSWKNLLASIAGTPAEDQN